MLIYYNKNTIEAAITQSRSKQLSGVISKLCQSYTPLINSSLRQLPGIEPNNVKRDKDLINWFESSQKQSLIIDVLTLNNSTEVAFILELKAIETLQTTFGKKHYNKNRGYLVIYAFGKSINVKEMELIFLQLCVSLLKKSFKLSSNPNVSSISIINDKFEEFRKKKHSTESINSEILSVANLFKEKDTRSTMIRTLQAKDPTFQNILKSTGLRPEKVKKIIAKCIDRGIIERQYNCICSKCGNTLARVSSKDSIKNMEKDGVSCASCRTKVSSESCADCFIVEKSYGKLLEGSKWLAIYIRNKLEQISSVSRVLESVMDGPNELDLVSNIDGSLLMIELKDNRFSIGHAYSFVGKCTQYQPDISIIVATEGVDSDVKEYINNIGMKVHYIEQLSDVDNKLAEILSEKNGQIFTKLLEAISWDALFMRELINIYGVSGITDKDPYSVSYRYGVLPAMAGWVDD